MTKSICKWKRNLKSKWAIRSIRSTLCS